MSLVWKNLEFIEENYEQIFLKTHRIQVKFQVAPTTCCTLGQANRVCLGDLTGVDFAGERHPDNCPCEKRNQKERLDRERMERRKVMMAGAMTSSENFLVYFARLRRSGRRRWSWPSGGRRRR